MQCRVDRPVITPTSTSPPPSCPAERGRTSNTRNRGGLPTLATAMPSKLCLLRRLRRLSSPPLPAALEAGGSSSTECGGASAAAAAVATTATTAAVGGLHFGGS